ncbi:putative RNA-directed DNA polymerase from transposon X-element [Trichonephila clavipes]|nr:putative RNA-directed DNA polymerase from transposon X-element [Trichonephila clavipes]
MLNFEVDKDLHNSDHFPFLVSHINDAGTRLRLPTYHFYRADRDEFTQTQWPSTDEAVLNVTETIRNAADAAIVKTSNLNRKLCKPWWNSSCQQAKKEKRRAWGYFQEIPHHWKSQSVQT